MLSAFFALSSSFVSHSWRSRSLFKKTALIHAAFSALVLVPLTVLGGVLWRLKKQSCCSWPGIPCWPFVVDLCRLLPCFFFWPQKSPTRLFFCSCVCLSVFLLSRPTRAVSVVTAVVRAAVLCWSLCCRALSVVSSFADRRSLWLLSCGVVLLPFLRFF